jgi:cytochrome c biogenesis protein CcmG/thiol:disulfide interchange protein DsbE
MSRENYEDDEDDEDALPAYRERVDWGAPAAAIPVDGDLPDVAAPGEEPPERPRPSRGGAWLAMGAVALALLLVYLAPGVKPEPDRPPEADAAAQGNVDDAKVDAAFVGRAAPLHFTLKDMNGVDVRLDSFKGKVILLNFWATWCPPCELEIPWLVEIQRAHPNDVVVLGVSIDDPPDKLQLYAAGKHMNYPVLVGRDREDIQDAFGPLFAIPVSVFIDRDGTISSRHSGIADKAQFEKEIQGLL